MVIEICPSVQMIPDFNDIFYMLRGLNQIEFRFCDTIRPYPDARQHQYHREQEMVRFFFLHH